MLFLQEALLYLYKKRQVNKPGSVLYHHLSELMHYCISFMQPTRRF